MNRAQQDLLANVACGFALGHLIDSRALFALAVLLVLCSFARDLREGR